MTSYRYIIRSHMHVRSDDATSYWVYLSLRPILIAQRHNTWALVLGVKLIASTVMEYST